MLSSTDFNQQSLYVLMVVFTQLATVRLNNLVLGRFLFLVASELSNPQYNILKNYTSVRKGGILVLLYKESLN
jgi:hypothetical protein